MTDGVTADFRRELIVAVLNRLVPPEDGLPGAGAVALDQARRVLQGAGAEAAGLSLLLDEIERAGGQGAGFVALPAADQDVVLRRVERSHPDLFAALVQHTYGAYYSHPRVLQLLGLPPGPPQPRGHILEESDFALLDRVRQRGPLYRPA